jgi:glycine oxidase
MAADDVIVIGAGVIGGAIAWRLACAGARVRLVERDRPGAEASSAAGGALIPSASPDTPAPLLQHWRASLRLYPAFVADLQATTGMAIEFRTPGRLVVALSEADLATLRAMHQQQADAGIPAEWWSADQIRAAEPTVSAAALGGLFFAEHSLVDNRRLVECLAMAVVRRGGTLQTGRPVTGLLTAGERVVGVDLGGEHLAAGAVVNAAGSWAGLVDWRFPVPVAPAQGQILALETRPPLSERLVNSLEVGLVPRRDGRLIVGATIADVGYDKRVTAGAIQTLLSRAIRLYPNLVDAPIVETWAGLRPVVPADRLPLIGPDARAGLYHATGHFTMGILSAPATAEAVAGLILDGQSPLPVAAFAPTRFDSRTATPPAP